jgi:hypothetical protein
MSVKELIAELNKLPEDSKVIFRTDKGIVEPTLTYANKMLFIED